MKDRLKIEFAVSPRTVTLQAAGEVDFTTVGRLREAITFAQRRWAPAHVVIDLAAVSFLDSQAVRTLLAERDKATESGCAFSIAHPRPVVERTLQILGVLETLQTSAPAAGDGPAQPDT